jgi:hypothetical protein
VVWSVPDHSFTSGNRAVAETWRMAIASNSPHQRILSLNKSNLSDAASLTYRTVKQDNVITIDWIGESSQSVDELMKANADRYRHSQFDEACFVLYSILAEQGEPMPAKEIKQKAGEALVSERTLKRAKIQLGVPSRRRQIWVEEEESLVTQWVWELPKDKEVLRPYKERAIREHVDDLLEDIESDPAPAATSEITPDAEAVPMASSHPCDESDDEVSPDWEPSGRPWDD